MKRPETERDLRQVQQWLQAVITHPEGVVAGIASPAAREALNVSSDDVAAVIRPSQALSSIERLEIYAGAYYARLLDCMRQEFPALVHALGEETFDAFAFGYLQAQPSRSYTLCQLAAGFPSYLAETRPPRTGEVDESDGAPDWADFLIDLATLERTYSDVFDGPGIEGRPPLGAEALAGLSVEQWLAARLLPAPCLRLLKMRFAVHEYATAVREGGDPDPPEASETWLVVTRRNYVVRRAAVSREEFRLLSELTAGRCVGAALEAAAPDAPGDVDRLGTSLGLWFSDWAAAGYFVGLRGDS